KGRDGLIDLSSDPAYPSPIGISIFADLKDPTRYSVYANQSGLGLPGRDYYLLSGAKYVAFRKAYRAYLTHIQELARIPDAAAKAGRIIALETQIAKLQWTPEKSRETLLNYNPMSRAKLNAFAPQFRWNRALNHLGLDKVNTVVVGQTSAIKGEAKLLDTVPLQTWKDWLAAQFVSSNAAYLPKAFDDARFDFYSRT